MEQCELAIVAHATGADLILTVRLDGQEIWQGLAPETQLNILHKFDDLDAQHVLEIEMQGKRSEHTQLDNQGNIVQDRLLSIDNILFDGIEITQLLAKLSEYHHDFNGNQPPIVDQFYGTMGCNGIVRLQFSSPVYLWLLENM